MNYIRVLERTSKKIFPLKKNVHYKLKFVIYYFELAYMLDNIDFSLTVNLQLYLALNIREIFKLTLLPQKCCSYFLQ